MKKLILSITFITCAIALCTGISHTQTGTNALAKHRIKSFGYDKIITETHRVFTVFGTSDKFFCNEDLTNFPTLTRLGWVKGIVNGSPSYVDIQVGNHYTGYVIEICENGQKFLSEPEWLIFTNVAVHR